MSAQSKDHIANSLMRAVCVTSWVSLPPVPIHFTKQQQNIIERVEKKMERISILCIVNGLSTEEKIRMWEKEKRE